ncbi:MAG: response regulator [Johnsonella sp.]|nr:response regulator [Johnsonella sp.]
MLSVLIADDEHRICMLIEKLIDWESMEMEVIARASNGIEALELIRERKPDIVITDIRMPGYDGIELIAKSVEDGHRPEFIIISGYRHFEYARSAIRYGVSDYLLKPIKKSELKQTLEKLRDKFLLKSESVSEARAFNSGLESSREALRSAYFSGLIFRERRQDREKSREEINAEYGYAFCEASWSVVILKAGGRILKDLRTKQLLLSRIKTLLKERLQSHIYEQEIYEEENTLYLLLNFEAKRYAAIKKELRLLLDEILVQKAMFADLAVSIAAGIAVDQMELLEHSLKNASRLIEERLILGSDRIIEGEIRRGNEIASSALFEELNRSLMKALESLDKSRVLEVLRKLRQDLLGMEEISGYEILQMTKEVCNLYIFFRKSMRIPEEDGFLERYTFGANYCSCAAELFSYLEEVIGDSFEEFCKIKRSQDNKPIRLAKEYIQLHYAKPITLEEISEQVGLSPTYFSSVFKKDTGMTFLEYLSEKRMEEAKALLKDTQIPIAGICEQVGYSDLRHFTKLFIKNSGLKPNEYRKIYS